MIGARDPMGLVGQVLDGQYRVDEFIGEGGFSVVYRGYHTGLGEIVAIKCLKLQAQLGSALVESFVRRFRDEGRILYRLSQGNLHIVRSIASGTTIAPVTGSLVPYTVLEWLEGHSLAQDFDRRRAAGMKGRAPHEAAALFSTAFEAVAYAHEAGVVHRDLNPGNIFLTQTREGVRAKVLDFGVAKIISDHALEMGPRAATIGQIRMFSPAYAAPEQFDEKLGKPGPYTDVYTLALVFVEALRDIPAIEGENIATLISQTLDENRRPTPRTLGVTVPDELENLFVRAMAIRPEKRPQTAGQFWVEMAAALNIRNVSLPTPSPPLKTPPPAQAIVQRSALGNQTVRMTSPLSGNPRDLGSSPDVTRPRSPSSPQGLPSAFASTVAGPVPTSLHDGRFSATMLAPENMGVPQQQPQLLQQPYFPPQQQQQQQQAYGPPPPPILAIARDAGPPINANETTGSTMLSKPGG
ncbi:MAG: serine/threonine-protein kinase [Polyangiaceae bacterium]